MIHDGPKRWGQVLVFDTVCFPDACLYPVNAASHDSRKTTIDFEQLEGGSAPKNFMYFLFVLPLLHALFSVTPHLSHPTWIMH